VDVPSDAATTPALLAALRSLRDALRDAAFGLEIPGAAQAARRRDELVDQIGEYLLPRLEQLDAPLLMVVGGSTGAGKSTLVNSLVGAEVSPPGVLRPTTRAPVLACHPEDLRWFQDDRILPGLPRSLGRAAAPGGLALVATDALPPGVALLDSPDIDSVVDANRELARQLLAAADAWLFVTTAARYADAVPWDLLEAARERSTALSLVLDRVAPHAAAEVTEHLRSMLAGRGLASTDVLVVPETRLRDGLLAPAALAPVRALLDRLEDDAQERGALISRTLQGALESVPARGEAVARALDDQRAAAGVLRSDVDAAYTRAEQEVDDAIRGGALLRGEVLARWHDVVGTGDVMRAVQGRVAWLRDRLRALSGAAPVAERELRSAVESSVDGVVHAAADRAAERAAGAWREHPAGRPLVAGARRLDAASPGLLEQTRAEVRDWQGFVFDLVGREGSGRRATARVASLGVNGAGLTVMLAVFLHTGGLTGAEVAVAGGTSAVGQKVLEAIFGDQAIRSMAERARRDLMVRVERLLEGEAQRFRALLTAAAPDPHAGERLRAALGELRRAR
jgi:hypothetical protein